MKGFINFVSYVLNVILIIILAITLSDRNPSSKTDKLDSIKSTIVERERADLPLKIQEYERVHDIVIDSVVFTNKTSPYSGYIVTTWDLSEKQNLTAHQWAANGYKDKYVRKKKTILVELSNIRTSGKEVSWYSDWFSASLAAEKPE